MLSRPRAVDPSVATDGRRRLFRLLQYALAAVAAGIVLIVVVWPELGSNQIQIAGGSNAPLPPSAAEPAAGVASAPGRDTALNAVFDGVDRYGRPFQVTSPRAETSDAESSRLDLAEPVGEMTLSDGRRVHLTADKGLYDPGTRIVDLWGNVVFIDENGYRVETSEARVFLDDASITGPKPVVGSASFGDIDGTGFRLTDAGQRVFVNGPARMRITQTAPTIR